MDVFEHESGDLPPGTRVRVSQAYARSRSFEARVSRALPQFDPDSRTMKVRLEADNADYSLRPGMFVDAEIPVSLPAAVTVPADAVVDSGVRKTCSSIAATATSSRGASRRAGASTTTSKS